MSHIFSRILVGVDGSDAADEAVTLAARLAREHDGQLIACHAVRDPVAIVAGLKQDSEDILRRATETAKRAGVEAERRSLEGDPGESILALASAAECSLIVVATHDRHELERMILGSTTHAVLRGSTIPVLTVRAGLPGASKAGRCFERIFVGIDDSEPSDAALATVLAFPAEDRRHVLLCGVAGTAFVIGGSVYRAAVADELREQTERVVDSAVATARGHGVSAEGRVADGSTEPALIAAAREVSADLIVLGSHGRRGLRRLFLGSVAEGVVQTAPVPVLVVRTANGPFTESSFGTASMRMSQEERATTAKFRG